ncbi:hypothetical protein GOV12_03590 [Candidatus Pacearchaeota archaeon]|nr:hypothetical protein [Candidatus Pacearchaeota archaeon]
MGENTIQLEVRRKITNATPEDLQDRVGKAFIVLSEEEVFIGSPNVVYVGYEKGDGHTGTDFFKFVPINPDMNKIPNLTVFGNNLRRDLNDPNILYMVGVNVWGGSGKAYTPKADDYDHVCELIESVRGGEL